MFPQQFVLFSGMYMLLSFFIVVPPHEVRQAGFSTEYLFASYLGNEMRDFVGYHMRRNSLNMLIHSLLPLGFYFSAVLCTDYFYKHLTETAVYYWVVYVCASVLVALYGLLRFVRHSVRNHAYHTLAISLAHQATGSTSVSSSSLSVGNVSGSSSSFNNGARSSRDRGTGRGRGNSGSSSGRTWTVVANSINAEMLSERDKFTSGPHNCRVYCTRNWLIQTAIYSTHMVHKSDIHLVLVGKQQLQFVTDTPYGEEEWVQVEVHSINRTIAPFQLRLRAQEYHELRERLSAPVVNARNIVLSQSISERFVAAFKSCVSENEPFRSFSTAGSVCGTMVEQCIGLKGPHNCRVYCTRNWLIQTAIYSIHMVHKSDIHLVLVGKQQLQFVTDTPYGEEEWVQVEVHSINRTIAPFQLRLRAQEYHELRERLSAPVVNARNIVLSQSISERFVAAFKSCVSENEPFRSFSTAGSVCGTMVEQCIGCSVSLADVKLIKACEARGCGECFCRPLWCVVCLSKWFCARQDQNQPHKWLEGSAPCPTCRAKFCIADVSYIQHPVPSPDADHHDPLTEPGEDQSQDEEEEENSVKEKAS
ncbi:transmembrane protein 129-like [Symsagittifera roscoffensis]|uniref:transmembrane protein 129-like n=1 Tax=Symsagittifera roscoffensis TaxID=84072 RepID=UPI00307BBCEA